MEEEEELIGIHHMYLYAHKSIIIKRFNISCCSGGRGCNNGKRHNLPGAGTTRIHCNGGGEGGEGMVLPGTECHT